MYVLCGLPSWKLSTKNRPFCLPTNLPSDSHSFLLTQKEGAHHFLCSQTRKKWI